MALQPIAILRRIGPSLGPEVASVLGATTVRDLALWPPYLAARQILTEAFFPDRQPGADPDAPADLLPSTGTHPTERVFYRRLLIDTSPSDTAGLAPIESAAAIDVVPGLMDPRGFDRLATGALLTFSQSWFSQGLTLGQLLHSTCLAPGESTRMAVVDWNRRTRAATTEDIAETEELSNVQTHNRALSEVTTATAREVQQGQSQIRAASTTSEAGLGLGLDIGPLGLSASSATTTTAVMTSTSSFGVRDVAAEFAQDINDRTQQHASAARNRRASIVREVSQEEHETISTRVVTNYNHMHALTVQYYEVVQAFRVTTEIARVERCLFVPFKLFDFSRPGVIEQWRDQLARAALTASIARLLAEFGTVRVTSQRPWHLPVVAGENCRDQERRRRARRECQRHAGRRGAHLRRSGAGTTRAGRAPPDWSATGVGERPLEEGGLGRRADCATGAGRGAAPDLPSNHIDFDLRRGGRARGRAATRPGPALLGPPP